jgi:DNA-binding NtrC family response regulator
MTHRILLIEDEPNYRQVLRMMVAGLDVDLSEAEDGVAGLERLAREEVDLVLTDLNMPRMDGMTVLSKVREKWPSLPVVVITAYGTVDSAAEAIRRGAIDYLQKPFDEARLRLTLERALRVTDLLAENRRLREAVVGRFDFSQIVGESPALVDALRVAGQVAATEATVLVEGESGTGKELIARAVHYNSPRASGPFVAVNSAALPETLLEAELFGAEAGAYTGAIKRRKGRVETARTGTLFLDEIGDMPLSLQVKLLRLLQERTFTPLGGDAEQKADVRFVVATNRNLKELVAKGQFREDLYYRISGIPVRLPPLRKRGDDVIILAQTFAQRACEQMGRPAVTLSVSAQAALLRHSFPGNVRELANIIERAVLLSVDAVINASDLGLQDAPIAIPGLGAAKGGLFVLPDGGLSLEAVESDFIRQALERAGGNKSRAAKLLGLTRATLRYRLEKLGLDKGATEAGEDDDK